MQAMHTNTHAPLHQHTHTEIHHYMHGDYFVKVTAGTATSAKRETEAMSQGGKERERQNGGVMMKRERERRKKIREGQRVERKHVQVIHM